jgi:hypothetical protein
MPRTRPRPTSERFERTDRKLLQTRVSEHTAEVLQKRLERQDITVSAYLKRLVMIDLGLLRPEER